MSKRIRFGQYIADSLTKYSIFYNSVQYTLILDEILKGQIKNDFSFKKLQQ